MNWQPGYHRSIHLFDVETTDKDPCALNWWGLQSIRLGERIMCRYKVVHAELRRILADSSRSKDANRATSPPNGTLERDLVLSKTKASTRERVYQEICPQRKNTMQHACGSGSKLRGIAFDTMVAANLVEPNGQSIGLKSLVSPSSELR